MRSSAVIVYGEVLFDCFPDGSRVLGGAPFNVAWHLQALGDRPLLISRVGDDAPGGEIKQAMLGWGMSMDGLQTDLNHSTGQVAIQLIDDEPYYDIVPNCAYDFIQPFEHLHIEPPAMIYHGSLALRNPVAKQSLKLWRNQNPDVPVFMDVNLRDPWWDKNEVLNDLQSAQWIKLNEDELRCLGFDHHDLYQAMSEMQKHSVAELLLVTRGAEGAVLRTGQGEYFEVKPEPNLTLIDTVGAGDAFCACFVHGLLNGRPISELLKQAQDFASKIVSIRGAISQNIEFYTG